MNEKEIQEAVDNTIKPVDPAEIRTSVGAELYNIFTKVGCSGTPAQFKEFERQATKLIYKFVGADVGDALCTFDCLVKSYIESLVALYTVSNAEAPEDAKENE